MMLQQCPLRSNFCSEFGMLKRIMNTTVEIGVRHGIRSVHFIVNTVFSEGDSKRSLRTLREERYAVVAESRPYNQPNFCLGVQKMYH